MHMIYERLENDWGFIIHISMKTLGKQHWSEGIYKVILSTLLLTTKDLNFLTKSDENSPFSKRLGAKPGVGG